MIQGEAGMFKLRVRDSSRYREGATIPRSSFRIDAGVAWEVTQPKEKA